MADAAAILSLWEEAQSLPPVLLSQSLLSLAGDEMLAADVDDMTVGEVNRTLFQIRKNLFGPALEVQAVCNACGEIMEAALSLDNFTAPTPQAKSATLDNLISGTTLTVRAPNMADLKSAPRTSDRQHIVEQLLASCVRAEDGRQMPGDCFDAASITHIADAMAELDPLADIVVAISCPSCGVAGERSLDITHILQRDIGQWARHMLQDVHAIAAAYGWSERDILALSPARRRAYLDMIAS